MAQNLNMDEHARRIALENAKVIAIVGRSDDHYYTSYQVGEYLMDKGYKVYSVNPNVESSRTEKFYGSLSEIPEEIDIVDVFRNSSHLEEVVDEAIAVRAKMVWAQLGVEDSDAARKALEAGLPMVMDMCIRTEHERLFGS
jgi:uncharacterized protein